MFICGILNKQSKMYEKPTRITVETRNKTYKHWDQEAEEEWFSQGTEIVREVSASEEGAAVWQGWSEAQRAAWVKTTFHPTV